MRAEVKDVPWHWVPTRDETVVTRSGALVRLSMLDAMVEVAPPAEPGWDALVTFRPDVDDVLDRSGPEFEDMLGRHREVALVRRVSDSSFHLLLASGSHLAKARVVAVCVLNDYLTAHAQTPV